FSSRRRHTRSKRDWSSDVCSSDLVSFWRRVRFRKCATNIHARRVDVAAFDHGVWTSQVDVFKDAALALRLSEFFAVDSCLIDRDKFTGLYLTDKLCAHDIQRTGFGSNNPALRQAANNQGAHTVRVTRGVQGLAIGKGQ